MTSTVLLRFNWPSGKILELECTGDEAYRELQKFI